MLLIHIISKLENWNLKSKIRLNFWISVQADGISFWNWFSSIDSIIFPDSANIYLTTECLFASRWCTSLIIIHYYFIIPCFDFIPCYFYTID